VCIVFLVFIELQKCVPMAEQRSIVLGALILALLLAGGTFYFFVAGTVGPGSVVTQLVNEVPMPEPAADSMAVGEEAAAQAQETLETAVREEAAAVSTPAVAGVQDVMTTAETGPSSALMLAGVLATLLGLTGVVVTFVRSS
jgi:hypothetical protein